MLQQTTVRAVIPYYLNFLDVFPDLKTLVKAPLEKVLKHWAGLGYYSRARNLHACARIIFETHNGEFPEKEKDLLALPGIGPYTAAAISALAFDKKAVVVDGNIERVLSRLFLVRTPLPKSRPELKKLAASLTPERRPGDYAEALMDLGATICTPRSPDCRKCPVKGFCAARGEGAQETVPRKAAKKPRPVRKGAVFWLENQGKVLTRRRPERGLLGGMPEFPTTPWETETPDPKEFQPAKISWKRIEGPVTHTFTHFHLILDVYRGKGDGGPGDWVARKEISNIGLPAVMKKVAEKVLAES